MYSAVLPSYDTGGSNKKGVKGKRVDFNNVEENSELIEDFIRQNG